MSDPTTTPTPTETLRERAGRALYEHRQVAELGYPQGGYTAWDELPEDWQDEYREAADAVLAAVSAAAPDERALGVAADLIDWLADARDEYASAGGPYADAIRQETALARILAQALRSPEDAWGWLPTWMVSEYEARHAAALAARPAPVVSGEAVEAAARRLYVRTAKDNTTHDEAVVPWADLHPYTKDRWLDYARDALTAALGLTVADAPAADDEGGRTRE